MSDKPFYAVEEDGKFCVYHRAEDGSETLVASHHADLNQAQGYADYRNALVKRNTPAIAKADLEHGAYYAGHCRNAQVARWDAQQQQFRHWRTKFGQDFLEYIRHPEDERNYDVFVVQRKIDDHKTVRLIPLEGET